MAKKIFITGGASGLGKAIAHRYADSGYQVLVGDINAENGAAVVAELNAKNISADYIHCDVTKEPDLIAAADWLQNNWGGVDIVVNNAGVATSGSIETAPMEDWEWVININLLGVVRGCKAFTPMFKQQGSGHFINIASMAGLIHPPLMSSYNATKAAVVALSETMRIELDGTGIGVSVVCPGFFRTNLGSSMRTTVPNMDKMLDKLFERSPIDADDVADIIYQGQQANDFHILPHKEGKQAFMMKRYAPFSYYLNTMIKRTAKMRG